MRDCLSEETKQWGFTQRPALPGVVRFASDINHFAAVKMDLQNVTVEVSDAAKARIGTGEACGTCPNDHCEGLDKADAFRRTWRALCAAVPTPRSKRPPSGSPPRPSCRWDLHRCQRGALDTNCGIIALTDLRGLRHGSPLCCDATIAAEGRAWAQLRLWAESDLALEVNGPVGVSRTVEPEHYCQLSAKIAGQWAAAVQQRHRGQMAQLRKMDILEGVRARIQEGETRDCKVRGKRGHHRYLESLLVGEKAVTAAGTNGVQLVLASLMPRQYVSKGVLEAATASATKDFGWRTWERADGVSETAPILLSCDYWTRVLGDKYHAGMARKLGKHFGGCKAPTLVGAVYEGSHYAAVTIILTRARMVVRDSMRTKVNRE